MRQSLDQDEAHAVFLATEAELALAYEEALEMAKILRKEWPHITPDGAVIETVLPDWRAKTMDILSIVLGSAQRAAFKGAAKGEDELARLDSEARHLGELALKVSADGIRVQKDDFQKARARRRENEAAEVFVYDHSRISGL